MLLSLLKTISTFLAKFTLVLFCVFSFQNSYAQKDKKTQLQNQYKQIQEDLKKIESLISSTKTEQSNSLNELQEISSKISARQSLIANINAQIKFLQGNIDEKLSVIKALENDIKKLQDDYALMVKSAYQNKFSSNPIQFIFSSESFNQAIQRFTYMRSYAKTRQNQAQLIHKTIEDLHVKIEKLELEKQEKQDFLNEELQQKNVLEQEKNIKNSLIDKLKSDEANLKQQYQEKNKAKENLNAQIQKIIEDEIKAAKEKAAKDAVNSGTKAPTGLALTPAEKQLSTDFINNQGKLPWPVAKGFIVERFGQHEHPSLKNVYTNNNGIDIKTEKDAQVRSVFNGTVVNSFYLPASQNSVIIKHGEYYSVYSNLKTVSVSAGDKINTKQSIGSVHTQDGLSKVHLEIWKGTTKINPELWLAK